MISRLLGYILLTGAIAIVALIAYRNSGKNNEPLIFSPLQIVNATWLAYKSAYVEPNTFRTVDTERGGVTTSEGQSYTMLRAVWIGDKDTFDGAWAWTKTNLQHTDDHLFAWIWGKKPDGTLGVLNGQGGEVTASDADTDIALSLVFAYARWQDPMYLQSARTIIADIWDKEVVEIQGTPYLAADNLEKTLSSSSIAINPSYLNPAAYRIFSRVDSSHAWFWLVDSSYTLLQNSISSPLDVTRSANLPPDWIQIDKTTARVQPIVGATSTRATTNFGFDALRVPYHLALDWEWFNDPRDKTTLQQLTFLSAAWNNNQKLASTYTHDGKVVQSAESPAMYGGTIGYFMVTASTTAQSVYEQKLAYLYDPGRDTWKEPLAYYDDNWAWFGIALYNRLLPNLAANLPASAFKQ
jgi:endo-1,4-beta-D-glucanase Y